MPASTPATVRSASVSSMRSSMVPPCLLANRRFRSAVSALPRWSEPVGLGAKRTWTDIRRTLMTVRGRPGLHLAHAACEHAS